MNAKAVVFAALALGLLCGAGRARASGLNISPVQVWLSPETARSLLTLRNEGPEDARYQVSVVAWDEDGSYAAGVGRKQHDAHGHELSVGTDEHLRGRGMARRLVAQAARRVIADGAVPTYLHSFDNTASARVADAAGFPDRGWQVLELFQSRN